MRALVLAFLLGLCCATASAQSWTGTWLSMVSETQSEQPHWVTPVVTVTPRLEQELRLDFDHEDISGGYTVWNLDGGKGVEVIPAKRIELIFNLPPYFT